MYNDNGRYKMEEPDKYKNKDHKKAGQRKWFYVFPFGKKIGN